MAYTQKPEPSLVFAAWDAMVVCQIHAILSMEVEVHGDAYAIIGMPLAMLCTGAWCGDVTANIFRYSLLQHLNAMTCMLRCWEPMTSNIFNSEMAYISS